LTELEVRAPFLDYRVVEFVNKMPHYFKMKGLNGKYILNETMRGRLPGEIIDRPPKGFGIPASLWLKNKLKKHSLFG
jgi:asparagine synthase (glutamine-hydrolysing)